MHALAVADREEQAERRVRPPALPPLPGPTTATMRSGVDAAVVRSADVDQHATVADVVGGPTVPARPHPDCQPVLLGMPYCGHHVVGVPRLDDQVGEAIRQPGIQTVAARAAS